MRLKKVLLFDTPSAWYCVEPGRPPETDTPDQGVTKPVKTLGCSLPGSPTTPGTVSNTERTFWPANGNSSIAFWLAPYCTVAFACWMSGGSAVTVITEVVSPTVIGKSIE